MSGEERDQSGRVGVVAASALDAHPGGRAYLYVENLSTAGALLAVNLSGGASLTNPGSRILGAGEAFAWEGSFVPTNEVSVIASAADTPYTLKYGLL